ncbi:MAG: hypothetical protein JXB49_00365, partial [Bacteroidales bacterium]|nr:hypothetical protein [Bacteroidales bacterium]
MKNIVILLLLVVSNLTAQEDAWQYDTDPILIPKIKFKDWDNNKYLPVDRFENGGELEAVCYNGDTYEIISYNIIYTINGLTQRLKVNSNRFDREALEIFKQIAIDDVLWIDEFVILYLDGTKRKTRGNLFVKVQDEFTPFVRNALDDNPLIEDFGVFKSNIRIKLEGKPDSLDCKIVNELVDEIKPLFKTVSIELVDNNPTFVLDFKQSDYNGPWSYKDSILNPLFQKVKRKHIIL